MRGSGLYGICVAKATGIPADPVLRFPARFFGEVLAGGLRQEQITGFFLPYGAFPRRGRGTALAVDEVFSARGKCQARCSEDNTVRRTGCSIRAIKGERNL